MAIGQRYPADASIIAADANRENSTPKVDWNPDAIDPDDAPRAVRKYLETLDDDALAQPALLRLSLSRTQIQHPNASRDIATQCPAGNRLVHEGPAYFAYSTHYLIDTDNAVVLGMEATLPSS